MKVLVEMSFVVDVEEEGEEIPHWMNGEGAIETFNLGVAMRRRNGESVKPHAMAFHKAVATNFAAPDAEDAEG